jgi:hypothetical protein
VRVYAEDSVVTQVESGVVALEDLTPEQRERLRAAVRILIDYLLDRVSLKDKNETQTEAKDEPDAEAPTVQLPLDP